MGLKYYQTIIDRGGGIITLPQNLGVMVGTDPRIVPAGWLFVDIEGLTAARLKELVDEVRPGRENWPKAEFVAAKRSRGRSRKKLRRR